MADVKFCGLTRPEDAREGAALGAAYLGVVFAGGPRQLAAPAARAVLDGARPARRVGVFGLQSAGDIAAAAHSAALDVVQLHGASDAALIEALRRSFSGEIWRVVRLRGESPDDVLRDAGALVDAVVIDARVDGTLGGSGVALDWERLAARLDRVGRPARLVLAGGLKPENVERAVGLVAPDVVDVSSGVEKAVGIKDHAKMRAFAVAAARGGR